MTKREEELLLALEEVLQWSADATDGKGLRPTIYLPGAWFRAAHLAANIRGEAAAKSAPNP